MSRDERREREWDRRDARRARTARQQHLRSRALIDAGYEAERAGLPCEAPASVTGELDRGAWEMGWRAARHERGPRK